tara:strand:+ start:1620 stop:3257 length:1638 start_codon:yes stop_codon:yes gene_type:complete
MSIAKDDLQDIYEENVKRQTEGKKDVFPFGYKNKEGTFVPDLETYKEIKREADSILQDRNSKKDEYYTEELDLDNIILQLVIDRTGSTLDYREIINKFNQMYKKAVETTEEERSRPLNIEPKPKQKAIEEKTSIKYKEQDIKPTDKSKFVQIMLREIKDPTPEKIENAWKKLLAGEDMGFESTEELEEIKANYDKEEGDPELRKVLIRLARKSKAGKRTVQKVRYNAVIINEYLGSSQKLIFYQDNEENKLRPFTRASGSLRVSMTEFKNHINTNSFPKLETAVNTWLNNNGYTAIPLPDLLKLVEDLFLGTSGSSLEGKNNSDFYDNIWEMQSNIKQSVKSNVEVDTVLDKVKLRTINKNLLKDLDLKNNFSLQELGTIIVQRPEIEDVALRDKVIKFLDEPVNDKTYGYFMLRAILSKLPYKMLLRKEKPKQSYVVEDTTYRQNLLGKAEELKKALEELNSKQRRKVKTYLQDADPTEYFGEEYLKLGKLINILDQVEGNTGDIEGLEEENLKMIKVAASLRKKYENLYRKLREKVYPEDEEE